MNKGIKAATGECILWGYLGDYFYSKSDFANVFNGSNYEDIDIINGDSLLY